VRVNVHGKSVDYLLSPRGAIGRRTLRAAGRIRDRAKDNVTADTGLLRNSIVSERQPTAGRRITYRIGSNVRYARWQEVGVGPIYARRAPLLVFKVKGKWVSVYSTRGVPAQRYLTKAVEATSLADFR
jgi:hypothetical protein